MHASHLYAYQATFVPPLLQARDHAEALTSCVLQKPVDDPDMAGLVDARVKRRETLMTRLESDRPPSVSQAIDESVLLRPVGAFEFLTCTEDSDLDVVFIETQGTDFLLIDTENTAPFRRVMDELLTLGEGLTDAVQEARRTHRP